jgi:hypothetical protein
MGVQNTPWIFASQPQAQHYHFNQISVKVFSPQFYHLNFTILRYVKTWTGLVC